MPEKVNELLKNPKRVLVGILIISVLLRVFTGVVFYGNEIQETQGNELEFFQCWQYLLFRLPPPK